MSPSRNRHGLVFYIALVASIYNAVISRKNADPLTTSVYTLPGG